MGKLLVGVRTDYASAENLDSQVPMTVSRDDLTPRTPNVTRTKFSDRAATPRGHADV